MGSQLQGRMRPCAPAHEVSLHALLPGAHLLVPTHTCPVAADVTKRMDIKRKLAELTSAQMSMLEQMFPRCF